MGWQNVLFEYFVKLFRDEETKMAQYEGSNMAQYCTSAVHYISCEGGLTIKRVEVGWQVRVPMYWRGGVEVCLCVRGGEIRR